jgi:hypothetical protein
MEGKESACREGSEVIELNFESARLLPLPLLLCKIPTISTPLFGLDLLGELRREGSTTTVVWERCFVELLGGGSVVPVEASGAPPSIKSAQRRDPISSDVKSMALVSSRAEEGVLLKIRRKRSLKDFFWESVDFGGNVHDDSSCDGGVDGREVGADCEKNVENRLSIFTLVSLLPEFIVFSVSVSAELFSFISSAGVGEAES